MRVLVLNGPNLDLLGTREPEVYGRSSLADLEKQIAAWGEQLGVMTTSRQFNHEGDLVEAIHDAAGLDGIIINPGALAHTSRSIGDAIRGVGVPAVEVHISNVTRREAWRATSLVSEACARTIYGRGVDGYLAALRHLVNRSLVAFETIRYGPHPENVGDLRLPQESPVGLVVLVHGGLWRGEYERDTTEMLAIDLIRNGYATWNIEYRRQGRGGGWPGAPHDVLMALDFTRHLGAVAHLPEAIIGHSAGGHLGLWAAGRRRDQVGLVVGLAAVTDLAAMASSGGVGAMDARELLDSGAPARIGAVPGKTLLIHGEVDDIVPVAQSTRLEDTARVEVIAGLGHFALLDPTQEPWPISVDTLRENLN